MKRLSKTRAIQDVFVGVSAFLATFVFIGVVDAAIKANFFHDAIQKDFIINGELIVQGQTIEFNQFSQLVAQGDLRVISDRDIEFKITTGNGDFSITHSGAQTALLRSNGDLDVDGFIKVAGENIRLSNEARLRADGSAGVLSLFTSSNAALPLSARSLLVSQNESDRSLISGNALFAQGEIVSGGDIYQQEDQKLATMQWVNSGYAPIHDHSVYKTTPHPNSDHDQYEPSSHTDSNHSANNYIPVNGGTVDRITVSGRVVFYGSALDTQKRTVNGSSYTNFSKRARMYTNNGEDSCPSGTLLHQGACVCQQGQYLRAFYAARVNTDNATFNLSCYNLSN